MKYFIGPLLAILIIVSFDRWMGSSKTAERVSTTYRGQIANYDVEIFEEKSSVVSLVVHLYPLGDDGERKPDADLVYLTGHRSEGQKEWDKIFFCGMPTSKYGCNAFENRMGEYIWAPCNAQRDLKNPFSIGEVVAALRSLDDAIIAVHNHEHATKH